MDRICFRIFVEFIFLYICLDTRPSQVTFPKSIYDVRKILGIFGTIPGWWSLEVYTWILCHLKPSSKIIIGINYLFIRLLQRLFEEQADIQTLFEVKDNCKRDEPLHQVYRDTLAGLFTPSGNISGI